MDCDWADLLEHAPLGAAGVTLLTAALLAYLARRLLGFLQEVAGKNDWLRSLGSSLIGPAPWLILGLGTLLALEYAVDAGDFFSDEPIRRLRRLFVVISMTWLLLRWKSAFDRLLQDRMERRRLKKEEQAVVTAVSKLMTAGVFTVAGLMILEILGVPLSFIYTFGGVSSLAITWAASDVVKNFFGGLMIFVNRPFTEGDWIKSPNKGFEGVVEHIGWYLTKIRTFERRPTFIPNALITDAIIENPGRMYNRRIKMDVGLRYEDVSVVVKVRDDILKMLNAHPGIDQKQLLMVDFLDFGPYSLNINVYCFTKTTNWGEYRGVHQDVLVKMAEIVQKHGAQIAFPTSTVHLSESREERD